MAGPRPDDPYASVPKVSPNGGMPSDYVNVRVNPNTFGGQFGQAIQGLGKQLGNMGDDMMSLAIQRQGMLNETLATDAETAAAAEYGSIIGKYRETQGLEAVKTLPMTISAITNVRQKISETLPNDAAKRAFNTLASRREAFLLQEANSYSAQQLKAADRNSAKASFDLSISQSTDPSVAFSDVLFGDALGNIKFQSARILVAQGYGPEGGTGMKQDPKTGNLTFDDTEEGRSAKAVYDNLINDAIGKAWENRINTLAFDPKSGNVVSAVETLDNNKSSIPAETYAKLSAKLSGPYRANQARTDADSVLAFASRGYQDGFTSDTQKSITDLFPGLKITSSKRTPEHNAEVGGVPNSQHISGTAVDVVLPQGITFDNFKKALQDSGIKTSELIDEGDHVHVAWGDKPRYTSPSTYLKTNYADVMQSAREQAQKRYPNDITYQDLVVSRTEQRVNDIIRTQELAQRADQEILLQAADGKFTNKQPLTNISQIESGPTEVREAWNRFQLNNPVGAQRFEKNILTANSRGQRVTYGTDFWKHYLDISSERVSDPSDLMEYVGGEDNSPLTNTGYKTLVQLMQRNNTPEGHTFQEAERKFLQNLHKQYTGAGLNPGVTSTYTNSQFQQALKEVLPKIAAGQRDGKTAAQLFSPKINGRDNPDYITPSVQPPDVMALWRRQMLTNSEQDSKSYANLNDLVKDVGKGITREKAIELAIQNKWVQPNKPSVPVPNF